MHRLTQHLTLGAVVLALTVGSAALGAQARPTTQPQFKGILEPVSYTEDLDLKAVFFVNGEVGWVSGNAGTILRTVDAGKTWEAQLGGDPENKAPRIGTLYFLDEHRGWAVQGEAGATFKMLHTRDGENWEEIGSIPYGASELVFTSPQTGFVDANPGMAVSGSAYIYRTTDGGRTWKQNWQCQAKVNVGGLTRNISCVVGQIQFPSPQVGYAALGSGCSGWQCGGPSIIAKTTDAGESWNVLMAPGEANEEVSGIFFLDENTGFVRLTSKKLHVTTDGGQTWRGIVATPGPLMRFADPSVGWAVEPGYSALKLSFTTDGGKRWAAREMNLPTTLQAFSMPRRDRAYLVGNNGMVFRYSVVPATQPLGPNDVTAPAMPGFESPLDEQVEQLEEVFTALGSELKAAPPGDTAAAAADSPGGFAADSAAAVAAADSAAAGSEPFEAPLPPASEYMASCCKKSFSRLEVILGAMSQTLPEFIGKYRNLNLLLAAIRMGAELPSEYRAVKGGLRAFRKAQDKESAQAALAGVSAALSAFKQTTAVSMQQELPPPPPPSELDAAPAGGAATPNAAPNAAMSPASSTDGAAKNVVGGVATDAKNAVKDTTKAVGKDAAKEAADKAKKALGGLFRKKKP